VKRKEEKTRGYFCLGTIRKNRGEKEGRKNKRILLPWYHYLQAVEKL
jgi:hypothetical protein